MSNLKIGHGYDKKEMAVIINEPKAAGVQTGLLYCDNQNSTFLFVTLDKKKKEEQLHYNDFFEGDYFEWDSQNIQSFASDRIQDMYTNKVNVYLMARVSDKLKGKTQPFIYCGKLEYYSHDESSNNPVHITFTCKDFQFDNPNDDLKLLYNWKPGDVGRNIDFKPNYKKTINPKRKVNYKKPNSTERKGLVTSRVGQGYYRQQILEKWNYTCAVTKCNIPKILIASHIVSWKDSTEEERLDPENGILLSPNYDSLFDKHLITFSDDGSIIFSKSLKAEEIAKLGIDTNAKIEVNLEMLPFLKKHHSQLK
jgi:hypothetical protein